MLSLPLPQRERERVEGQWTCGEKEGGRELGSLREREGGRERAG
jgi:hypothetical protein